MKITRFTFSATLAVTVASAGVSALADDARLVSPLQEWSVESLERFDSSWLHLKWNEGTEPDLVAAPTASGVQFASAEHVELVASVNDLLRDAVVIRRTFPGDRARFRALKEKGEAASGQPGPDLSLWFDVQIDGQRHSLAAMLNALNQQLGIEIAHPAPICEPAIVMSPAPTPMLERMPVRVGGTPDFTSLQNYLYETPVGLDAPSAWAQPGGRGAGMKFIDVELGWTHAHEDFDPDSRFHDNGNNDTSGSYRDHGTAVVGEVVGQDNGFGITGFASDAQWGTVGILINEWPNVPHRFLEAAEALDKGDAWLIGLQMYPSGRSATPMEWLQVNFDVIWTSSWAMDVVCVEAGANGSQDLDHASWGGVFDRNVRDSGAIMVGAGTPTGRVAEGFSNYGSRMDAHAWGSSIVTTGYGDLYDEGPAETEYTSRFGGTSGASPMVTGTAMCLQGIALDRFGYPLKPPALRQLINETGIPHLGTRYIGPRPDLGAAVAQLLDSTRAHLTGFEVATGTLLDGDLNDLRISDDASIHTRSGFGRTLVDLHHMRMDVGAVTTATSPLLLDITIESRLDHSAGTAEVYLFNRTTGQQDLIATYALSSTESAVTIDDIDATHYVSDAGEMNLSIKHVVHVPFLAFVFESWVDLVEITVE